MTVDNTIVLLADMLWGWPLITVISASSLYFAWQTGGFPLRQWAASWLLLWKYIRQPREKAVRSTLRASLGVLGASLGNGTLAGMATALASGGPGTLIWLWVFGVLGLSLRFFESYISLTVTQIDSRSKVHGGPLVYIQMVPGGFILAKIYAVCCLAASFVAGCAMQANAISQSIQTFLPMSVPLIAGVLTICLLVSMYGGSSCILSVSAYLGPVKVICFFAGILGVLLFHFTHIIPALYTAVICACSFKAFWGACMGMSVMQMIRYSFSRAASASEVGLGTAGVFMSTADRNDPYQASLMSMATLSISIFIVCTGTMLAILVSDVLSSGLTGSALTSAAFQTAFGIWGAWWVTLLTVLFGLGVMIGYAFIGLHGWRGLWGDRAARWPFYVLYAAMVWWGCLAPTEIVWHAVDLANGGMLLINIYALVYLFTRLKKHYIQDRAAHMSDMYRVACHTDHVGLGTAFVAIAGTQYDGHDYIQTACARGATTVFYEEGRQILVPQWISAVPLPNTRKALSSLSAQAYQWPARDLKIIAITGTKGKTTTTFLLEHILRTAGRKTARLSTISNSIRSQTYPASLTTAQPDYLHHFFHQCVQQGVEYVVMEVAAQAESMHRLDDIVFHAGMFMNFSQEHGEFYASQELYFSDKQAIMNRIHPEGVGFYSGNDDLIAQCAQKAGHRTRIINYNDVLVRKSSLWDGLSVTIDGHDMHIASLLGNYNAYNVLYAVRMAQHLGLSIDQIARSIITFGYIPGRLNKYVLPQDRVAFIDYAHNPSSIESVLSALKPLTKQLVVVTGAGGDRDKDKRPAMMRACIAYADHVWLTTDNPRSEDPLQIIEDMCQALTPAERRRVHIELDREVAIRKAYQESLYGACLVLMGKGPDEYQLIKGIKHPFCERDILNSL